MFDNLRRRRWWHWPAVAGITLALLLPASAQATDDGLWHDSQTPTGCAEAAITSYVDGILRGWTKPCTNIPAGSAFGIQVHHGGRLYLTPTLIWYSAPDVVTPWAILTDLLPEEGARLVVCPSLDEVRRAGGPLYQCLSIFNPGTGTVTAPFSKKDPFLGTVCICFAPEPPNCGTCL